LTSWYIYGIRENTENSEYRYIGYTTSTVAKRLSLHLLEARKGAKPYAIYDWTRSKDFNIIAEKIEEILAGSRDILYDREKHWISHYRELQGSLSDKKSDNYLLNHTDGGGGALGYKHTPEECARRAGRKGFWAGVTGPDNPSFGKTRSEAHRKAVSGSKKGKRPWNYGQSASLESRQKMSQAKIGTKASEITKLKMSFSQHSRLHESKIKETCKWCQGADLQNEIEKKEKELIVSKRLEGGSREIS
jgi:hypothetical protein